jgi:putative membrane protein
MTIHRATCRTSSASSSACAKRSKAKPSRSAAHQQKLDQLKKLSGQDFARQYHAQQVAAHQDAVELFQRYAKGGDNAALKDWAAKTLPALQHHLDMAQSLDKRS